MHNLSNRDRTLIATVLLLNATELSLSGKFLAQLFGTHHRYLENGLQLLSKARILKGERGPYGGYKLAVNGDTLHLLKILDVLQRPGGKISRPKGRRLTLLSHIDHEINQALRLITIGDLCVNLSSEEVDKVARRYERQTRLGKTPRTLVKAKVKSPILPHLTDAKPSLRSRVVTKSSRVAIGGAKSTREAIKGVIARVLSSPDKSTRAQHKAISDSVAGTSPLTRRPRASKNKVQIGVKSKSQSNTNTTRAKSTKSRSKRT